MAAFINESFGEKGYIRKIRSFGEKEYIRIPRWHVRPWKSVAQQSNALEDENLDSSFVPNDFDDTREWRGEERYIKGRNDVPVNPFIQKILNMIAESENDRPFWKSTGNK